jgi:hypothetical protein
MRHRLQKVFSIVAFVGLLVLVPVSSANAQECRACSKGKVKIPISLAIGTVRTPVLIAKHDLYQISIQFQGPPAVMEKIRCKVGFDPYNVPINNPCRAAEVLIEAKWRVLDGNSVVAQGAVEGFSKDFDGNSRYIRRYIGDFQGEAKHEYVVEVTFTKDGSSLNVANPQLIVSPPESAF